MMTVEQRIEFHRGQEAIYREKANRIEEWERATEQEMDCEFWEAVSHAHRMRDMARELEQALEVAA